jgi:hypothetical protein
MIKPALTIKIGSWQELKEPAQAIRLAVFVQEQHVPIEMEWDAWDASSVHAVALVGTTAAGTGRLLPDGHIGRMAVMKNWRGKQIGSAILQALLMEAEAQGHVEVVLHAQTSAMPFYRRFGFAVSGDTFMEAGLPHVEMKKIIRGKRSI